MKFRLFAASVLCGLVFGTPAIAHEQLVDQQPTPGQQLEAGVVEILLDFSDDLIELEDAAGSEIVILDASGNPVNNGCAVIDGRRAIAKADIDQAGSYQVGWRVVSGDGHPISGSFSFEVTNDSGYVADPNYIFADCANPYNPETTSIPAESPQYLYWLLWASLPIAALALFLVLRPRKSSHDKTDDQKQTGEA